MFIIICLLFSMYDLDMLARVGVRVKCIITRGFCLRVRGSAGVVGIAAFPRFTINRVGSRCYGMVIVVRVLSIHCIGMRLLGCVRGRGRWCVSRVGVFTSVVSISCVVVFVCCLLFLSCSGCDGWLILCK